jgi:hypothetical protein
MFLGKPAPHVVRHDARHRAPSGCWSLQHPLPAGQRVRRSEDRWKLRRCLSATVQ